MVIHVSCMLLGSVVEQILILGANFLSIFQGLSQFLLTPSSPYFVNVFSQHSLMMCAYCAQKNRSSYGQNTFDCVLNFSKQQCKTDTFPETVSLLGEAKKFPKHQCYTIIKWDEFCFLTITYVCINTKDDPCFTPGRLYFIL